MLSLSGPVSGVPLLLRRSPFGDCHCFRISPSSGPLTVLNFSIETPESDFQRSHVHQASRRQKTQPGLRHSDWERWALFLRQGTSTPDQFVRTKLSQLEVPEAFRTTRFSAGPGISGEVNLAFRFESSMGFFIPVRFFVSRSIGFHSVSRAGEHISWLAERVNRKLHIFCFSPHRRFRRAPRPLLISGSLGRRCHRSFELASFRLRGGESSGINGEVNGFLSKRFPARVKSAKRLISAGGNAFYAQRKSNRAHGR